MNILGIYDGHNSNSALIKNGSIIAAVEEERFSRVKNHDGRLSDLDGPFESVRFCLKYLEGNIHAISLGLENPYRLQKKSLSNYYISISNGFVNRLKCNEIKGLQINKKDMMLYPKTTQIVRINKIMSLLKKAGISLDNIPIYYVNHHLAHASSAYYSCNKDKALIITMDGKGDGLAGMVAFGENGSLKVLDEIDYIFSIGHLYSAVTIICGFQAIRHEGKITGLSAYGKVKDDLIDKFNALYYINDGKWFSKMNYDLPLAPYPHTMFNENVKKIRAITKGHSHKDIAASIQFFTEEKVLEYISYYVNRCDSKNLLLAGGLFANVKINQRISEIPGVKFTYVHPAMTDAGIGVGAALYAFHNKTKKASNKYFFNNVFFGPEFSYKEIENEIKVAGLSYERIENMEEEISTILANGNLVARFVGRLEYGPRALGNRSILYHTTDKKVNIWLNQVLDRTEFMPFAPITLEEAWQDCYISNSDSSDYTAQFMTITYHCTDLMKKQSPAVVHVDGTARPQLVSSANNPGLHLILKRYYDLTGIPSLINTSFNVHEEPIVCSPRDAIKSFLYCDIDFMQMGPFLIEGSK